MRQNSWRFSTSGRPEAVFLDVTPAMAAEALANKADNRRLSQPLVRKYARLMQHGNWKLTHQGAAFNKKGELIDSQHRMNAITLSNTTVRMLIVTGLDGDAVIAIDAHRARSETDRLRIAGVGEDRLKDRIAVIRALSDTTRVFDAARALTIQDIADVLSAVRDELDVVLDATPKGGHGVSHSCYRAALLGCLLNLPAEEERILRFARLVSSGTGASTREAGAIRLREYLLTAGTQGDANRKQIFLRAQRALKAFLDGHGITKLYAPETPIWPCEFLFMDAVQAAA